jgi:hypothetical protein
MILGAEALVFLEVFAFGGLQPSSPRLPGCAPAELSS